MDGTYFTPNRQTLTNHCARTIDSGEVVDPSLEAYYQSLQENIALVDPHFCHIFADLSIFSACF